MANSKYAPQRRYDDVHSRRYNLKLNKGTDADIVAKLDGMIANGESVCSYIKALIREDMRSYSPVQAVKRSGDREFLKTDGSDFGGGQHGRNLSEIYNTLLDFLPDDRHNGLSDKLVNDLFDLVVGLNSIVK